MEAVFDARIEDETDLGLDFTLCPVWVGKLFQKSPVVSGSDTADAGKGDGGGHRGQPTTRLESFSVGRSFPLTVRWICFPTALAGVRLTDEDAEDVSHCFTSPCRHVGLTVEGL